MPSNTLHWNQIFATKADQTLGWYEADISQTLKFLDGLDTHKPACVFVPGAGTSALVDALIAQEYQLILNDISDTALTQLADRVGRSTALTYLHHNMAMPLQQDYEVDIWIDRAVLHFLLSDAEITGYFDNLLRCVKTGGYVLLAEFSENGAQQCAGLPVHQYTLAEMQTRLGPGFQLITAEDYTFINPFEQERPYLYGLFQRL